MGVPVTMQLPIYFDHVEIVFPSMDGTNGRPQTVGAVDYAASE